MRLVVGRPGGSRADFNEHAVLRSPFKEAATAACQRETWAALSRLTLAPIARHPLVYRGKQTLGSAEVHPLLPPRFALCWPSRVAVHDLALAIDEQAQQQDYVLSIAEPFF